MPVKLVEKIGTLTYKEFVALSENKYSQKSKNALIEILKNNLADYERKYHIDSHDFIKRYEKGEFENNDKYPDHELFRWSSDYNSYIKLVNRGK